MVTRDPLEVACQPQRSDTNQEAWTSVPLTDLSSRAHVPPHARRQLNIDIVSTYIDFNLIRYRPVSQVISSPSGIAPTVSYLYCLIWSMIPLRAWPLSLPLPSSLVPTRS